MSSDNLTTFRRIHQKVKSEGRKHIYARHLTIKEYDEDEFINMLLSITRGSSKRLRYGIRFFIESIKMDKCDGEVFEATSNNGGCWMFFKHHYVRDETPGHTCLTLGIDKDDENREYICVNISHY